MQTEISVADVMKIKAALYYFACAVAQKNTETAKLYVELAEKIPVDNFNLTTTEKEE